MKKAAVLHYGLLTLAALALAGMLAFLYDKTQAGEIRGLGDALSRLRELKDIDARWDADVQRSSTGPDTASGPAGGMGIDRRAALDSALRRLSGTAGEAASKALSASLFEISLVMRQKAQLIEDFKVQNQGARVAQDAVARGTREMASAAAGIKPAAPVAATLRSPAAASAPVAGAPAQALASLDTALQRLGASAPLYFWLAGAPQQHDIEAALADVEQGTIALAGAGPDTLQLSATQIHNAARALITHKQAEQKLMAQMATLPTGVRINQLTLSLERELEASLQEKEVYRAYLIGYAAALLILLGWLVAKLRAANTSLEKRVQQRTVELSDALLHLKESEAQLIQSEKMSSLGQMVAGVAHEINTPLAYVKNSLGTVAEKLPELGTALDGSGHLLSLLQGGADANPEQLSAQFALVSQQLGRLKQQGVVAELAGLVKDGLYGTGQMAEIVGNLKDFSRLDRSKVTSFNLNDGIESTLLLAKHLLKSITVEKQFGDIPAVVCSPSQINQVFLNLITNAAQAQDALPPGQTGKIVLTTRAGADGVTIEVLDSGKGIPADVLPKIFDPFFSTKEIGKGTGLGLSISFKIVQQHGGNIAVESTPGKGTRFTLRLPLKPPSESAPAA